MPTRKQWEDEEEESSEETTEESEEEEQKTAAPAGAVRRNKFDDEEAGDGDVLDSWDAAEDSEAEREKAKKAADAKAKADAEAAANKKSKAQRRHEHIQERARQRAADDDDDSEDGDDETDAQRRDRLRRQEKEADLKNAEDLFGGGLGAGGPASGKRAATNAGSAVIVDPSDPTKTLNLASLPLFNPSTKAQFQNLLEALVPVLSASSKKAHYALFLQDLAKQLAKDLPSDSIKKVSSTLTALSNEKMKEEKAADKTTKKSKAQKTKTSLAIGRPNVADTNVYEDTFGDDDFM